MFPSSNMNGWIVTGHEVSCMKVNNNLALDVNCRISLGNWSIADISILLCHL